MAKVKSKRGYRFIKELGGAVRRSTVSYSARWLVEQGYAQGDVLDYGCGFGFDADHYGWEAFDPYYRQRNLKAEYDTIICNHVLNMLTRTSREHVLRAIQRMLSPSGAGYLIVPRNILATGKIALRKRIQNYVVLTLPTVYADDKREIYQLQRTSEFNDKTNDIELRLNRC